MKLLKQSLGSLVPINTNGQQEVHRVLIKETSSYVEEDYHLERKKIQVGTDPGENASISRGTHVKLLSIPIRVDEEICNRNSQNPFKNKISLMESLYKSAALKFSTYI